MRKQSYTNMSAVEKFSRRQSSSSYASIQPEPESPKVSEYFVGCKNELIEFGMMTNICDSFKPERYRHSRMMSSRSIVANRMYYFNSALL